MIIIIAFIALFSFFFFTRKHTGLAQLAALAGLYVFTLCSFELLKFLKPYFPGVPKELLSNCLSILFFAAPALLLYFCSPRSKLFSPIRFLAPIIAAALFTTILIPILAYFFPLDHLSLQIKQAISHFQEFILAIGFVTALADILLQSRHQ